MALTISNSAMSLPVTDDQATADEDLPVTIAPLENDTGTDLHIVSARAQKGTVDIIDESGLIYTPAEDFFGSDIIT
ncbi:MAG: Ig-like domain-containing protein [Pseudomonadota bacterium]